MLRSWCHALAAIVLLRPVHEVGWHLLALAVVQCAARVVGRNVSCFKPPNQRAVHDMRLNPSKTRVAFLSDVAPLRSSLLPEATAFADDT